ncbi:MAG: two-component system, chemotaxis family, response regulator CheB [Candidatus Electronema aureum]|uniref:protein-glutamate methylesterase n=1 Tax=Candidatus Electronema aureum TaxID=2005002 RepID=A0A521G3H8_9BACT|nr:MAG: two-component system, chemotaxis family, response regulator CheB [Candidatus Electronema aureum]
MDKKYKVLVVDDATFMTKAISDLLESDPEIEVIGVARNGLEGLKKIKELHPDVITLDIDMPVMDGLQAIRHIMIEAPVPIVVLSSLFSDGSITFEALRLGVVDFVAKPSGAISSDIHVAKQQIVDRIKLATAVNFGNIRRVRVRKSGRTDPQNPGGPQSLVVIGTSLTGPNSFIRLMTRLESGLSAAAVILLEISPKILPAFVEKFNEFASWKIAVAEDGKVIEQGVCYIQSNVLSVTVDFSEYGDPCFRIGEPTDKPLDTLFISAAETFREKSVGVLLTGYGDDGSEGFAMIQKQGGKTIAQSVESCVYPNLTDSAIKRNRVDMIVEESRLAEAIVSLIKR